MAALPFAKEDRASMLISSTPGTPLLLSSLLQTTTVDYRLIGCGAGMDMHEECGYTYGTEFGVPDLCCVQVSSAGGRAQARRAKTLGLSVNKCSENDSGEEWVGVSVRFIFA